MNKLLEVLKWIFAVIFFLSALMLMSDGNILSFLFMAICGILLLPPIQPKLYALGVKKWMIPVLIFVAFLGAAITIKHAADRKNVNQNINRNDKNTKVQLQPGTEQQPLAKVSAFSEKGMITYDANGDQVKSKTEYEILKAQNLQNIKFTYDLRLNNNKLTKDELRQLAMVLKNRLNRNYDRIFIAYYLPGQVVDGGAWATSHFDPDLQVVILGLTEASAAKLKESYKEDPNEDRIGTWITGADDSAYLIVLFKKDGKVFESRRDGNDRRDTELVIKNVKGKTRYIEKGDNADGDYFMINSDGELGVYDQYGFIEKYTKYKG